MVKITLFKIPHNIFICYCLFNNILTFYYSNYKKLNLKVKMKLVFFKNNNFLLTNFCNTTTFLKTCIFKFWFLKFNNLKFLIKFFLKKNLVKIKLNLIGIGFKFIISSLSSCSIIQIKAGFSHKIFYKLPISIKVLLLKPTTIILIGSCYQTLFDATRSIKNIRLPNPYKKKGLFYANEIIKTKQGKIG